MIDVNSAKKKDINGYHIIDIHPMTGDLGVEISNVNLDEMDNATFAEIKRALLEYQVIVLRDQDVNNQSHIDFGKRFGSLYKHPYVTPMEKYPDMIRLLKKPTHIFNNGGSWHYDLTFIDQPPLGSILRLIDVPKTGGDTLFSNMYSAYDALSTPMKEYLNDLKALNSSAKLFGKTGLYTVHKDKTSMGPLPEMETFVAIHPLVRTHPETGRKALFVNPGYMERIMGIPNRESQQILSFLCEHCARAEFTSRLKWRKDTLAMWDNRCSMHFAMNDYQGQRREGVRVTVEGDTPV